MMARWLAASFHLLALGIGLGAVWARGRALRSNLSRIDLGRVFLADTLWGIAFILWVSTGLWRLLAGLEKGTGYYLQNHVFLTKMALLVLVLVLEIRPMVTLIKWRRSVARGDMPDTTVARRLAAISFFQAGLIVLMVFAATAMARGVGI
jgi:putative membrane protein